MIAGVRVALALVLLVVTPGALAAQIRATSADLVGQVVDQTGAVLPGVTVTATNVETSLLRSGVSDATGRFSIPALPPGAYRVRAELQGFAPRAFENVVLTLGSAVHLDVTLQVEGLAEVVVVQAEAPLVDPQKTQFSATIARDQIDNLPTNGRHFISFATLTPGVAIDRTPQQGASATSGITFAGQRARSNNITVDGLDNNDHTVGGVRAVFSQDAVREFQVLTHSFSAEFGKASGGVINIVTRSGTNAFGGTLFGYVRDEVLNARERFEKFSPAGEPVDRAKASYGQLQYGGTAGGPVRKNKLFFFSSFERLDIDANNFVTIDDEAIVRHPFLGAPLGSAAQILRNAGFPIETGNVAYAIRSTQFLGKIDQQLGASDALTYRYNTAASLNENVEPFGGLVARSRSAALDSRDYMFAASYMRVGSARLVNEARFQIAYRDQTVTGADPSCEGPCDREDEGGPTLEVIGVANAGRHRFTPQPRRNVRYQVLDTLSYAVAAHLFKAGIEFNYIDTKQGSLPLHFGGRYIFASLPAIPGLLPAPVSSIQAVALGLPAAYVQGYGDSRSLYGYKDVSLFAQDDWRIRDRLTVKLGVRYQNQLWPDKRYDVPGYPETYAFPGDANNVAPRVALAWNPDGERRTKVHAAYGMFYDNHITGVVGISDIMDGSQGVRTLALRFPAAIAAWNAPLHRLPESAAGVFPSLVIAIDPGLKTPFAHHVGAGVERDLGRELVASAGVMYVRGFNQLGTIDYNPLVPALGQGRRPGDLDGRPGTSASVLQYTAFGETWYRGLVLSLTKRLASRYQILASYTLSRAEDNSTDFQSAFVPQDNGRGRDQANPKGLPVGFDPDAERGPSVQDQRHRVVLSGTFILPADFLVSSIVTAASGRPYNILAGVDLNGDGDGGAFPPDRARRDPADPASSVGRNSGVMPAEATVDVRVSRRFRVAGKTTIEGILEVFNLFNRTNYRDINNVFGTGAYPDAPAAAFGRFEQAGPPRQIQLAARVVF